MAVYQLADSYRRELGSRRKDPRIIKEIIEAARGMGMAACPILRIALEDDAQKVETISILEGLGEEGFLFLVE